MLQGLHLEIDRGSLLANGKDCGPDIVLWENTSPKKVEIWISGDPTELRVKNVFDTGLGIAQYWRDGAAMYAEENDGFIRYFCNDGEPDEDFDDLVFRMQVK